jgi:hypothetical protein
LRTSISPTMLSGGFRENVIPSQAEAMLDIRALPDEDMTTFYAPITIPTTFPGRAPSAIRTPISCVRCATE